jgi:nicotinamidase-related amidase
MNYTIDLTEIEEYNTHQASIDIKNTALLVIEMQNVFKKEMKIISDEQIKNINTIIDASEKYGAKIIYVRHNDTPPLSQSMIDWWGSDKIEYGSKGWEMIDGFDITGKKIIDKNQYSAFFKTDLDEFLKSKSIKDIIITGVMANCCCETTARDAFMRGYRVFFINDATATINKDLHLSTIKNLSFGFACIKNTNDLITDLERK